MWFQFPTKILGMLGKMYNTSPLLLIFGTISILCPNVWLLRSWCPLRNTEYWVYPTRPALGRFVLRFVPGGCSLLSGWLRPSYLVTMARFVADVCMRNESINSNEPLHRDAGSPLGTWIMASTWTWCRFGRFHTLAVEGLRRKVHQLQTRNPACHYL